MKRIYMEPEAKVTRFEYEEIMDGLPHEGNSTPDIEVDPWEDFE